jgi:hypothetical protein
MARTPRTPRPDARLPAALGIVLGGLALLLAAVPHLRSPAPPAAPSPDAAPPGEQRKAVYHADFADPRRFSAMLTAAGNLAASYQMDQQPYDLRIVFIGHGIRFVTDDLLKGTPYAEDRALRERRADLRGRLLALHEGDGVKLELCNRTREAIGLEEAQLYPGVELVPSGEARLVELQAGGYGYLKTE